MGWRRGGDGGVGNFFLRVVALSIRKVAGAGHCETCANVRMALAR